jgi:hypothetical protein
MASITGSTASGLASARLLAWQQQQTNANPAVLQITDWSVINCRKPSMPEMTHDRGQ